MNGVTKGSMKELKQDHINYTTLINTIAIIGIIFFFFRKWKEMVERENERDRKLVSLERSMIENSNHVKAVLTRLNKKMSSFNAPPVQQIVTPPSINEEVEVDDKNDINSALESLMS